MTPLPEDRKAANELAERHVALEGSLKPEDSLRLARALIDSTERLQHVTEAIKTALSALPGEDAKELESYEDSAGQFNALKAFRAFRVNREVKIGALVRERDAALDIITTQQRDALALRAELETVKREVAGLKDHCKREYLATKAADEQSAAELSALRTRLEVAGKDTKRLDWLFDRLKNAWQGGEVLSGNGIYMRPAMNSHGPRYNGVMEGETERSAIDAAMSATQPEGKHD